MAGAVCVVFAAIIALSAVHTARRNRREHQALQQWADQHGWTLTRQPDVDWGRQLPGGNNHGVSHCFSAVLSGRPVTVAAYSVTDASDGTTTNNTHQHVVTVAALRRALPPAAVEPRGPVSRLTRALFGAGETATGHTDFDRAFRIRAAAGTPAAWVSPELVAAHLAGRVPASWSVRGNELLCHRPGHLQPHYVPGHAAVILSLADLLDGRIGS